jgi:hypothetical protein
VSSFTDAFWASGRRFSCDRLVLPCPLGFFFAALRMRRLPVEHSRHRPSIDPSKALDQTMCSSIEKRSIFNEDAAAGGSPQVSATVAQLAREIAPQCGAGVVTSHGDRRASLTTPCQGASSLRQGPVESRRVNRRSIRSHPGNEIHPNQRFPSSPLAGKTHPAGNSPGLLRSPAWQRLPALRGGSCAGDSRRPTPCKLSPEQVKFP